MYHTVFKMGQLESILGRVNLDLKTCQHPAIAQAHETKTTSGFTWKFRNSLVQHGSTSSVSDTDTVHLSPWFLHGSILRHVSNVRDIFLVSLFEPPLRCVWSWGLRWSTHQHDKLNGGKWGSTTRSSASFFPGFSETPIHQSTKPVLQVKKQHQYTHHIPYFMVNSDVP